MSKYTVDRHDRQEYATQVMFREMYNAIDDRNARASLFGIARMQELRRDWGVDFKERGFRLDDFSRLGDMLPDDSAFDEARTMAKSESDVRRVISMARSEYDLAMDNGLNPVLFLDPDLQERPGVSNVRSFHTYTIRDSIRNVPEGESRTMYDINGRSIYETSQGLPHNPNSYIPRYRENLTALINNNWVIPEPTPEPEPTLPRGVGDEVEFMGWSGQSGDGVDTLPGIGSVLGAYFTESDQVKLRKHFDREGDPLPIAEKHIDFLENSVAILQYLRSNGVDFELRDPYNDGHIDINLTGMGSSVRVFDVNDEKPGQYIGRYYDSYGYAYLSARRQQDHLVVDAEESLIPLKFMLGHIEGESHKTASTANSQVHGIDGFDGYIHLDRNSSRYNSVIYKSEEEAIEYLEFVIEDVGGYFDSEFKLDDLKNALAYPDDFDLEDIYSFDERIREKQEAFVHDAPIVSDMIDLNLVDDMNAVLQGFELDVDADLTDVGRTAPEIQDFVYDQIRSEMVGDLESGFNASYVMEMAPQDDFRTHSRNAIKAAIRYLDYDVDKLKGNDFATKNLKDDLIKFDEESSLGIDEVDDPYVQNAMQRVQDNLTTLGVIGADKENPPEVRIDDKGVMRWEGHRTIYKASSRTRLRYNAEDLPSGQRIEKRLISGEIGQVVSPDEHGIIKTKFESGDNYGFVPGYTGFFEFDGEYSDDRMERFRVKGFEQHMNERIDMLVRQQISRPLIDSWDNIPDDFDASNLNRLFYGDVYGRRVDLDFVDKSKLKPEVTSAIIESLSNRVRFGNEYGNYSTTNAEHLASIDSEHRDQGAFSYWKVAGETNMRMLREDIENIADLTMTGNARTQGVTWYLVDGAEVQSDGTVKPSAGIMSLDGTVEPDKSAIRKLDFFKHEKYNAWDRVQMSANQLVTAEHVDENVGTALMTFGGWNYEDSFAVSKEFADRNKVQGDHPIQESKKQLDYTIKELIRNKDITKEELLEGTGMNWSDDVLTEGRELLEAIVREDKYSDAIDGMKNDYLEFLDTHGTFRPLKRGDKLSDFGGNKGTIGIVIDRDMDLEDAKALDLERETAIFKANPKLDVVGAPYSPLSRLNAGIVRELQDGEVLDIIDPIGPDGNGQVIEGALGELNFIVTDLTVDDKTRAYTEDDFAAGGGRLASGQLAWALQSHGAMDMLTDIYGHNEGSWAALREYFIVTGLDMGPDGELKVGYEPHSENEIRNVLDHKDFETADDFLNQITDTGGFLKIPFEVEQLTGVKTDEVPILSASLRKDTKLIDGSMRASDYNNNYRHMFQSVVEYSELMEQGELAEPADEQKRLQGIEKAKNGAQDAYSKIQIDVKEKQLDGGHNGKHSHIRDKVMGVRMRHSATGVAISDPRISVNEMTMDSEMMEALDVNEGEHLPLWRDPVWRKSAISAQRVLHDEGIHGFGVNPVTMGPKDGDLDGDTLGSFKLSSHRANRELVEKLSFHRNLIDEGSSDHDSYIATDQDFASARAVAAENGDDRLENLLTDMDKNARSSDERMQKKAIRQYDEYVQIAFRELGYGSDHINLNSRETVKESLNQMVERKTKGNPNSFKEVMEYYDGKKGLKEAQSIQYAKGVQTDDTGLGGAISQKLVSAMRNQGIDPALEVSYPVTQAILQIKHDADHAVLIDDYLRNEIRNLYEGKSSDGKKENMTKKQWVDDYHDVLTNDDKLGVDVRRDLVEKVADIMVGKNGNVVRNIDDVIKDDASPMDRIAYGGGWESAFELASEGGHSLLDGKMNEHFAPLNMRNYQEGSDLVVSRKDVRNTSFETEVKEADEHVRNLLAEGLASGQDLKTSTLDLGIDDIADMVADSVGKSVSDTNIAKEQSAKVSEEQTSASYVEVPLDLDDGLSL